jgi:hypothetical protein
MRTVGTYVPGSTTGEPFMAFVPARILSEGTEPLR